MKEEKDSNDSLAPLILDEFKNFLCQVIHELISFYSEAKQGLLEVLQGPVKGCNPFGQCLFSILRYALA